MQPQLLDKKKVLTRLRGRAAHLFPRSASVPGNRVDIVQTHEIIDQMIAGLEDNDANKVARQAYDDLLTRSRGGDAAATAELSVLRVMRVENFLRADSNALAFFEEVVLKDNEVPYIENTNSRNEILVSYLGQDGGVKMTQPIVYQAQQQVDLHLLCTEEFEYPLRDIYRGNVADDAKANVDLADDLKQKVDGVLWPLIRGQLAPFVITGDRALRTYVLHSNVKANNLPDTNLLEVEGNGPTTGWRKECLDAILNYCASFGNLMGDGGISPTVVYIPSSDVMGYLKQIQMTSQPNSMVEDVIDTGYILHYGGRDWILMADVTLDPDEGLAYVKTNKPIGYHFTKPGLDKTYTETKPRLNRESMWMDKVIGAGLPSTMRPNVIGVRYRNPRGIFD